MIIPTPTLPTNTTFLISYDQKIFAYGYFIYGAKDSWITDKIEVLSTEVLIVW